MTRRARIVMVATLVLAAAGGLGLTPQVQFTRTENTDSPEAAARAPRPADALRPRPSGTEIVVRQDGPIGGTRGLPDIEVAYRAFAAGDLVAAERMLTQLVGQQPSPAAYLLRGCTRYTLAVFARDRGVLMESAREDIRRAFAMNPAIWLDPAVFSPRLRGFLDEVRREAQ